MIVKGIYYVKSVLPAHSRLIGLFTGEERNLPRQICEKILLDNLSKLQFQLQSLHLQKVSDNLFRANKYLAPKDSKTWNFLLNKNRDSSSGSDCQPASPDSQPTDLDIQSSDPIFELTAK